MQCTPKSVPLLSQKRESVGAAYIFIKKQLKDKPKTHGEWLPVEEGRNNIEQERVKGKLLWIYLLYRPSFFYFRVLELFHS